MALDEYQQAHTHLGNSKNILVIAGLRDIEDTYPASIAITKALRKNNKNVTLFSTGKVPPQFSFLDIEHDLQNIINASRDAIISIDISQKPVKKISYDRSNSHLDIHVTPEVGINIDEQDIHISLAKFNYDSIVVIGVEDLTALENEFERNASLFYETPIINIDKNSSNERYGEVNIVDSTLSSCSEIAAILLKKWDENLITKEVATSLLAGLISATGNFQNSRTKPNTLCEAAYLMSKDADREELIKRIFKTRSFEFLKLLGIAMAKINYIEEQRIAWLSLKNEDFCESSTSSKEIPLVLTELKNNFSLADLFIIFWENNLSCFGVIHTTHEEKLRILSELLGSSEKRGNNLIFTLSSNEKREQETLIENASYALKKFEVQYNYDDNFSEGKNTEASD